MIIEWLTSPIVYEGSATFRAEFVELAKRCADRRLVARHYLHLGERQRRVHLDDAGRVRLKRAFYTLRPAAALRWLNLHPTEAVAPMHFPTLMAECDPPAAVAEVVADLIARKALSRELGVARLAPEIGRFIDAAFDRARTEFGEGEPVSNQAAVAEAGAFFRKWARRLDPPQHA